MRLCKYIAFVCVVALLLLLCACGTQESPFGIAISPSNKSLIELSSMVYDSSQLEEIRDFKGTIFELNSQYPIECFRMDDFLYWACYLGDESVSVIRFDKDGNALRGNIYSMQCLRSDFEGLEKGQFVEDVKQIDPNGAYWFLYTGSNAGPSESYHYTKDGYLITIEYNIFSKIIDIRETLI